MSFGRGLLLARKDMLDADIAGDLRIEQLLARLLLQRIEDLLGDAGAQQQRAAGEEELLRRK